MIRTISIERYKRKEGKRFAKFLVVGAAGFAVDFGVFNLAHGLGFGTWMATHLIPPASQGLASYLAAHPEILEQTLSFSLAVISNFMWNYFWIYPEVRGARQTQRMLKFVVVSVAGLFIGIPVFSLALYVAQALVTAMHLQRAAFNVAGNLALMTRVGVLLFWNFFVNRYWTYRDVE